MRPLAISHTRVYHGRMNTTHTERPKITKMRTFDPDDRHYSHPYGWRIVRCYREWSERGYRPASFEAGAGPRTSWEVWPLADTPSARRRGFATFQANTLRECRAWCDEHPRWAT